MSDSPSCLGSFGHFYANRMIPQDAHLLRKMFTYNGINSQREGCSAVLCSVIAPRIFVAPLTIPVAAISAVGYQARGILRFTVDVIDLDFFKAFSDLGSDTLSAMKCVALTVTNIAYAVFGLLLGSSVFANFIPDPAGPSNIEQLTQDLASAREQARSQEERANRAEQEAQRLGREIDEKNREIKRLGKQPADTEAIQKLEADIAGLRQQVEAKTTEAAEARRLQQNAQAALQRAEELAQQKEAAVKRLEDAMAQLNNIKNREIEALTLKQASEFQKIQEEARSTKEQHQAQVSQLLQRHQEEKSALTKKHDTVLEEAQKALAEIRTQSGSHQERAGKAEQEVLRLKEEIARKGQEIEKLGHTTAADATTKQRLEADIAGLKQQLETKESKVTEACRLQLQAEATAKIAEELAHQTAATIIKMETALSELEAAKKKELEDLDQKHVALLLQLRINFREIEKSWINRLKELQEQFDSEKKDTVRKYELIIHRLGDELESTKRAIEAFRAENDHEVEQLKHGYQETIQSLDAEISARDLRIVELEKQLREESKKAAGDQSVRAESPPLSPPRRPESPNWWQGLSNIGAAAYENAVKLSATTRKIINDYFIDFKDQWKAHRYELPMEQLLNVASQEIATLERARTLHVNHKIADNIVSGMKAIANTMRNLYANKDGHIPYDNLVGNVRGVLKLLEQNPVNHGIEPNFIAQLNQLCFKWCTGIKLLPFHYQMITYVASDGNKNLFKELAPQGDAKKPVSLSDKMRLLYNGIRDASPAVKAPLTHLWFQKTHKIDGTFDPWAQTNIPCQFAIKKYRNETTGEEISTTHIRTGVPIGPWDGIKGQENKIWALNNVQIIPEYRAFLRHLLTYNFEHREQKPQKLLVVLHLNPAKYDSEKNEVGSQGYFDDKYFEALWIKLMVNLSRSEEFKSVIEVALLPLDGKELKKLIHSEGDMSVIDLTERLVALIKPANSSFILPDMNPEAKEAFARRVAKKVEDRYFAHIAKSKNPMLKPKDMEAFYGFFCSMAAEELQFMANATIVQRNCADGIDRTMALVGGELADDNSRLNKYEDQTVQEQFLGETLGPALGTSKREVHPHRESMLFAVPEYLDKLYENIKLHPGEYSMGPVPTVQGFKLVDIEMPEEPKQSLYKEPSRAQDSKDKKATEEYKDLLRFELEHPCALPARVPLNHISEILPVLKERYNLRDHFRLRDVNQANAVIVANDDTMTKVEIKIEIENEKDLSVVGNLIVSVINPKDASVKPVLSWRVAEVAK